MKIKTVRISNFRTLKDVTIEFDSVTTFIGPNGAGKSTVLRALDWFFNGKAGSLTEQDCSFGATAEPIEVQVTFSDLTATDRDALGKYAPLGATTFTAWKRRAPDGSETISANAKGFPAFDEIKTTTQATPKKVLYKALRDARPDLALPSATTGPTVDEAIAAWEASHTDQLVDAPEALQTNFFGFNSEGKMSGLFDFVLVTADLRASEESVDGKASIVGRILERSVDRSAADDEIAQIVDEARVKQQAVYKEKFKAQLDVMTGELNEVVSSYAPGRKVSVSPSEVELKAPKTTFGVTILDGDNETPVERQGHGFQRTLLISALQLLAQSGAASDDGVICLAIEEPELFQHPIQAQAFAKVLRDLAEDDAKRIQIAYATHSPYFLEAKHFDQVRRLTRTSSGVPATTVHHTSLKEVARRLDGIVDSAVLERQLDGIVANQLAVALFASCALVVEGATESAVLSGIADRSGIGSLEASGLSIVPAGGKTSIPLLHSILVELGVPAYALFDADSGFEARMRANKRSDADIEAERRKLARENRRNLKYFAIAEEDFPGETLGETVAIFSDHLETFMQEQWAEWSVACAAVEDESGVVLAKNQLAYRAATLKAEGEVPEMLIGVLARAWGES